MNLLFGIGRNCSFDYVCVCELLRRESGAECCIGRCKVIISFCTNPTSHTCYKEKYIDTTTHTWNKHDKYYDLKTYEEEDEDKSNYYATHKACHVFVYSLRMGNRESGLDQ